MLGGLRGMKGDMKKAIEPLGADIAISDFMAYAMTEVCDELGLPTIVHLPNAIQGFKMMTSYMIPHNDNLCACCGVVCLCPGIMPFVMDYIGPGRFE